MIKLVQYRLFRRTEPAGKPPVFCSSEKYAKKERKVLTERGCSGIINLVLRRKAKNKTEKYAAVAHLVERHLAKVEVASSSLVSRSSQSTCESKWIFCFSSFDGAEVLAWFGFFRSLTDAEWVLTLSWVVQKDRHQGFYPLGTPVSYYFLTWRRPENGDRFEKGNGRGFLLP